MYKVHWSKVKSKIPYILSVLRLLILPALGIVILQVLACYQQRMDNSVYYNPHWFAAIGFKFIWNYLLLLIPYLILYALPFFRISSIVMSTIVFIFGVAEHYIILFRNTIIFPWDLTNILLVAKVSRNYNFVITKEVVIASIIFVCMTALSFIGKEPKFRLWMRAVLVGAVIAATVFYMNVFVLNRDMQIKNHVTFYYTIVNYNFDNGVLLNFCFNLNYLHQSAPEGYSVSEAKNLLAAYHAETPSIAPDGVQPDVIMIMSEAFTDLRNIADFQTNQPIMPFWDSLSGSNVIKKTLLTSQFGGNTANSEFEVLTGMNMQFFPDGTYPFKQYIRKPVTSFASILKDNGYDTLAVHPFDKTGWNRDKVFPLIGFDQFLGEDVFLNAKKYRNYISDASAFQYIIDTYESHKITAPSTPLFEYLITIQNHGGFTAKGFQNLITPYLPESYPQATQYLSLLHISDKALSDLIAYFQKVDHPVVIIFYGDHLPGLTDGFLDYLTSQADTGNPQSVMARHETQLLVWANYDISDSDLAKVKESYISNNYVSTYLSDIIGVQRTPFQQFLFAMHADIPAISNSYIVDSEGSVFRPTDSNLPDKLKTWIKEYEKLQYNVLYDSSK